MKATEGKLVEFLSQSKVQFIIPVYQRNYDWKEKQCQQLLEDILRIGVNEHENAHFVGSIVFIHDDVHLSGRMKKLTVIDGQQRLTTLTILYLALYHRAVEFGLQYESDEIMDEFLINRTRNPEEKLKLKATDNNAKALNHLIDRSVPDDYPDKTARVIENFHLFRTQINKDNFEIILKGINKLLFVEVSLERGKDDPQKIFESLNSTGLDLSAGDLIRNYVLMDLEPQAQEHLFKEYWEPIEGLAYNKTKRQSLVSDFIRDYMTVENKSIPKKNKVYEEFKQRYQKMELSKLEQLLQRLKTHARAYSRLQNPEEEEHTKVREELQRIKDLEVNVAYPFLMKVYLDYGEEVISAEEFIRVLKLVQSFVIRRSIVGLPTNALNKIFMALYAAVEKENYYDSIARSLASRTSTQRFPKDSEVREELKQKDVYSSNRGKRAYLLENLENFENKEPVRFSDSNITIEHIFPQKPDAKWRDALSAEEFAKFQTQHLNTLANLTFSGNNGALGNKSFQEKRDMPEKGYRDSRLFLNRFLAEQENWDVATYNKRFNLLWKRFRKIWVYPEVRILSTDTQEFNIFDAEEPTGKKLAYVIFREERWEVRNYTDFYQKFFQTVFQEFKEPMLAIAHKVKLSRQSEDMLSPKPLINGYFIETGTDSGTKAKRIKQTLTYLDLEDELFIKYAD